MGFFLRQSNRTSRWVASTLGGIDTLSHDDVVEEIGGSFWYYCYVLADFDPIRAEQIHEQSTMEKVAKAVMAKRISVPNFDD